MGGFAFSTKLIGQGGIGQSDQFGIFLTPIGGPDGTSNPPEGPVLNSILVAALLSTGTGPGYAQAAVFAPPAISFFPQLDLIPDTGVIASATLGLPGQSGNTAVIGFQNDTTFVNGSAFICIRSTVGAWSIQQQLVPGDGAPQGDYGLSACVFGNIAVVGSLVGSGPALYAFSRTGTTWAQFQQFQPSDIGVSDGLTVAAMTGNQLFLSAINQSANRGAVYVYTLIAGAYAQVQKLVGAAGDFFGISVSCDGSTLVIGAVGNGAGKAYVYTSAGGGTWNLLTTLTSSDGVAGDSFGNGVSVNGTLMCIGARNASVGIVTFAGAAYIFQFIAGAWTQTQKLVSTVPTTLTYFGWATSVYAGNPSWVAVGQPAVGNAGIEGSVFIFKGPAIAPVSDPFVTLTFKGEKVYT